MSESCFTDHEIDNPRFPPIEVAGSEESDDGFSMDPPRKNRPAAAPVSNKTTCPPRHSLYTAPSGCISPRPALTEMPLWLNQAAAMPPLQGLQVTGVGSGARLPGINGDSLPSPPSVAATRAVAPTSEAARPSAASAITSARTAALPEKGAPIAQSAKVTRKARIVWDSARNELLVRLVCSSKASCTAAAAAAVLLEQQQ